MLRRDHNTGDDRTNEVGGGGGGAGRGGGDGIEADTSGLRAKRARTPTPRRMTHQQVREGGGEAGVRRLSARLPLAYSALPPAQPPLSPEHPAQALLHPPSLVTAPRTPHQSPPPFPPHTLLPIKVRLLRLHRQKFEEVLDQRQSRTQLVTMLDSLSAGLRGGDGR